MLPASSEPALAEATYHATDRQTPGRVEFIDGRIVAMSGASKQHNQVALNTAIALKQLADEQGCRTAIETVRLRIDEQNTFYPDVMISCNEDTDTHTETAPCLITEILSPSTSWVDNGRKRLAYMGLPSLRHYLLVDLENQLVENLSRPTPNSDWTRTLHARGNQINLFCPAGSVPVDQLFD